VDDLAYFRDVYDAFNRRDVDRVLAEMSIDVDWPNAWQGGGWSATMRYEATGSSSGPRSTLWSRRSRSAGATTAVSP
jgi:hypothetical protein